MLEIINGNKDLACDFSNLLTITGIGECTAIAILAEITNFERFTSARQLAAYIGLTPKHRQSGSSVNGRSSMSKMGDPWLRKALYFPAISAKNHSEYFQEFAERLIEKGKKPKVIIGAVMRRLTHVIFGVLKYKEAYNEEKLKVHPKKQSLKSHELACSIAC
jgi:transposase